MSERTDEEIGADVRAYLADHDKDELRLMVFHEHVADIEGEAGPLLRSIARAHSGFVEAVKLGGTTAGEETRLFAILDDAVSLAEQLRAGGQS